VCECATLRTTYLNVNTEAREAKEREDSTAHYDEVVFTFTLILFE
jgi:hypothetical protein